MSLSYIILSNLTLPLLSLVVGLSLCFLLLWRSLAVHGHGRLLFAVACCSRPLPAAGRWPDAVFRPPGDGQILSSGRRKMDRCYLPAAGRENLALSYLISSNLILPHFILSNLTLPYLALSYLILHHIILPYLSLSHLILPYPILSNLTLSYLILPYLI